LTSEKIQPVGRRDGEWGGVRGGWMSAVGWSVIPENTIGGKGDWLCCNRETAPPKKGKRKTSNQGKRIGNI